MPLPQPFTDPLVLPLAPLNYDSHALPLPQQLFQPRVDPELGLYKTFVCLFGDCALVNTILGMGLGLRVNPSPVVFCNQYRAIYGFPRPPCVAIQHTILVIAISCKGQPCTHQMSP